jgi:hypothetical protein
MTTFSQRHGYAPLPEQMVPEKVTPELRNTLWNAIDSAVTARELDKITQLLWSNLYKLPIDSRPYQEGIGSISWNRSWKIVREKILQGEWYKVYDHLEFFSKYIPRLTPVFNEILEREVAAYRVIDQQVCQITDANEIVALQMAMNHKDRFSPIADHIKNAVQLLSNRTKPDYRNSIKESISAVESAVKIISNDPNADFGKALSSLEKIGKLDAALKKGFGAIYGWTSDQHGIRHALMDKSNLVQADAKLFLVMCSAFANYLIEVDASATK